MTERRFRKKVVELLAPIGAIAVENLVDPGTPDVVCVLGWLELKIAERPKRMGTRVSIDLRREQRIWLRSWRQHGGRAWTLTLLEKTWILHDGLWSAEYLGEVDEVVLRENATIVWDRAPTFLQMAAALQVPTMTKREDVCTN